MVWWLPISYPVYARFYENQNVHPCYCGQNIYIVFRCREFHRNYMSQRRATMLNMLLMGFFVYKNRLLFTACMLLSYTLDYIAFSVVVKKCKPLIRPFIRSLRICPKSVNTYIFALFIILCNVIIKPSFKWQLVVSALSPSDTTRDCRLNWTTRWPVTN